MVNAQSHPTTHAWQAFNIIVIMIYILVLIPWRLAACLFVTSKVLRVQWIIKINTNICTQLLKPHITSEIKRCALMIRLLIRMTAFFMNQEEKNLNLNSRVHEWVHTRSLHWFFLLRIHNMHKLCHSGCRRYNLKLESVNVLYARIVGKRGGGRTPLPPKIIFLKLKS